MSFYKNTHTEIIKIVPAITAESNTESQRPNVAIPIGSICSFDREDFGYPNDGSVIHLRCVKSIGNCIECYFCYQPSSFCPVCCRASRRDNLDVIFKEIRV